MAAGDVKLIWSNTAGGADCAITENDLARDAGLETAVLISLFCDRRVAEGERSPRGQGSRRGWFGDEFSEIPGDRTGSHLWLLEGSGWTQATARKAEQYLREALQILIDERVAEAVTVTGNLRTESILEVEIQIKRPELPAASYRYGLTWAAQGAA